MSNEASSASANQQPPRDPLGGSLTVRLGRIMGYTSAYNFYTVMYDGGITAAIYAADDGGARVVGTRGGGQLLPGTFVLVAGRFSGRTDGGDATAYIMGVVRNATSNQAMSPADFDVLVPNSGYVWDRIHNYLPLTNPAAAGAINANDGTPMDALGGEWGKYNPFGGAIHLGHFMAYLRATDRTGIWLFNSDELMRLAARSMQVYTTAREYSEEVDEGAELNAYDQWAFLPWEAEGLTDKAPAATVTDIRQDDPNSPPEQAPVDPEHADRIGIFRHVTLKGYLADIEANFISLPDVTKTDPRRLEDAEDDAKATAGLLREVKSTDGSYHVQSAKSITFEKYGLIPVPLRKHYQEDSDGDTTNNVKFNNDFGDGDEVERKDFLFGGVEEETAIGRSTLGLELHGFAINQQQANIRSRKDWAIPEEEDLTILEHLQQGTYADYRLDPRRAWMKLPKYHEMTIQKGRWEDVRYYASRSVIEQLDDGTIVIEDGYGSQFIMSGGNVFVSAPNDVVTAPGRNFVQLVPQDLIAKVGNAVDFTTTKGDIRLKAEVNLQFLAANGGKGGLLFESRAIEEDFTDPQPGKESNYAGIVFKAEKAAICHVAKDLYFHALPGKGLGTNDSDKGGKIVFHTEGQADFIAKDLVITLSDEFTVGFTDDLATYEQPDITYRFTSDEVAFGASEDSVLDRIILNVADVAPDSTEIKGLFVNGGFSWFGTGIWESQCEGSFAMDFFGTMRVKDGGGFEELTQSEDELIRAKVDAFNDLRDQFMQQYDQDEEDFFTERQAPFTESGYFINRDDVQQLVSFSLRTSEDYGIEDDDSFFIPQFRWQQFAAEAGQGKPWEEKEVVFTPQENLEMMPWPGKKAWAEEERYVAIEEGVYFKDGKAAYPTDGDNSVPLTKKVLAEDYLVNTF